ncbi:acyl-CoA dehydrogenase family protein [Thermomonospora cellulosilytica]|uniref:Acyl-CoA dehydrogenase n=1 Tax=Thermomonospora cellulosilytica TaxID=1411118 RepID=A0A7W3N426_9ACTN|nr:acyl-CoA dehydrogenase [Thermomonospora cellulosilytica]MBA9007179.1 acyl-CoA dehydrogenase [Thermomonospora cellulosilytica]
MDFTLGEELEAVRELARRIFTDHATRERIRAAERSETGIDHALWSELANTGLLGVALPEDAGGAGLGLGGLCVLLEEQGRAVAPVPLWPALVTALAVARYGGPEQRAALLPGVVDGTIRPTAALEEFAPHDPASPACQARRDGDGWVLTGTKAVVPSAHGAGPVLVSADAGLFLVEADAPGITWEDVETTSRDKARTLHLDRAPAQPLTEGTPGRPPAEGALDGVLDLARTALAAVQVGVAEGAMRRAADHVTRREQFGRPLGTFQAVQHQLADCYIEIEAMRVCLWHAISLLDAGEPAASAVLVAKWWAGEAGLNVVHRTQHLHGGIGVDVDYPIHRYFLWGKQISGTLGGASADLERLGSALAGASW